MKKIDLYFNINLINALIIIKMEQVTAKSFTLGNYLISSSLNERSIYIKIIDNVLCTCYESNLDIKEFRVSISIEDIYTIIIKTFFQNNKDYSLKLSVNSGILKLVFNAIFAEFLHINFEILIKEKIMSNDAQLSMNFHRIEQKTREIEVLKKSFEDIDRRLHKIESILPNTYIQICYSPGDIGQLSFTKISTEIYTLKFNGSNYSYINYENIAQLYNLKELIIDISSCNFNPYFERVGSLNVEKLLINTNDPSCFTSVKHISNFPLVHDLTMQKCNMTNIVKELTEIEHKINKLTLISCSGVNQTQLMTYCTSKNIVLDMR